MSVSEKTRLNRENKIIQAAAQLFVKQGYKNVTMDKLAESCNMVKATLYKYFPSKDDLFFVVCCTVYNMRWDMIKPEITPQKTGFQLIEEFTDNFINHAYENPDLFHFVTNSNQELFEVLHLRDDINKELVSRYWHLVEKSFQEYIELFKIGYSDNSIKKFDDFSIEMYYLYTLRGYLLERVIAILKFKKKTTKLSQEHQDFMKMISKEIQHLRTDLLNKIRK